MSGELLMGLAAFGAFFVMWGVLPSRLQKHHSKDEELNTEETSAVVAE